MEKIGTKIGTKPLYIREMSRCPNLTLLTRFLPAGCEGNKVVKNHHFVPHHTTRDFVLIFKR